MSTAAEILVIIVSSVLSVFLIIAITLAIYLIKLTAEIRRLAKSAQSTVSHIDSAVNGISKITSPIFVGQLVGKYVKKFTKKGKK
jgi:uncharacterized protein YoxC